MRRMPTITAKKVGLFIGLRAETEKRLAPDG
jgi:hypothetical protein